MTSIKFTLCLLTILLLSVLTLHMGSAHLEGVHWWSWMTGELNHREYLMVIEDIRLPRYLTAVVVGLALSLSGYLMQIYFRNPLAGPFVLGISSGASLGVALVLTLGHWFIWFSGIPKVIAAGVGALWVFLLVIWVSKRWRSGSTLLIFGLMLSYLSGALVSVLMYYAKSGVVKEFALWGMGSFQQVGYFSIATMGVIFILVWLLMMGRNRELDQLSFGRDYAQSLGVSLGRLDMQILIGSGVLTAWVTAYCGPIAFLGLMVPHMAQLIFKTHRSIHLLVYIPLVGVVVSLLALWFSQGFDLILPINTAMSIMGAPFVIWFLLRKRVG